MLVRLNTTVFDNEVVTQCHNQSFHFSARNDQNDLITVCLIDRGQTDQKAQESEEKKRGSE